MTLFRTSFRPAQLCWVALGGLLAVSCSDSTQSAPPLQEQDAEPSTESLVSNELDAVLGGQSGGEEGSSTLSPLACSCATGSTPAGIAVVDRNEGGCAELTLSEVWFAQPGFEVGQTVGGQMQAACSSDLSILAGEEVLIVHYERGGQDSWACSEYLECSRDTCGQQPRDGESPLFAEWARCDGQCIDETVDACAAHADEAQRGGFVRVLPLDAGTATYPWAGEQRTASAAELISGDCQPRHEAWRQQAEDAPSEPAGASQSNSAEATTATELAEEDPDDSTPAGGTCPLPPVND